MKKTIVAVMVAASAVLSAQALATNTAEVTILGEVADAANSCEVTPTGTLNNGIVRLSTVTTSEANGKAANTLFKTSEFGYDVANCAKGSANQANVNGLTVSVVGTTNSNANILENTAEEGAANIGVGIMNKKNSARLAFDGSSTNEAYTPGSVTKLQYVAGYVKINDTDTVTEGPVKGVATFTIDYTTATVTP